MPEPRPDLSIVIPVRNEAAGIISHLQGVRRICPGAEIIVVDGQSSDGTAALAAAQADLVITTAPGRAHQMNTGYRQSSGRVILFLHADTLLPQAAMAAMLQLLAEAAPVWGRFDVQISGNSRWLPVVAAMMNLRSRLTGVATGDQAIFVRRAALDQIGGLPDLPIMEDVALSKALRRLGAPLCLRLRVTTSGRRWDANGALRTIATMWMLRLAYVTGMAPARIARIYAGLRRG